MIILDRRNFLAITGGALAATGFGAAARAGVGEAQVFTADEAGALVDSTVILGDKKALLVDAQINVPNATRLADMIAATGRELETIWITHFHPDHVLGLAVLMDRFPNAKPLTHKSIRPLIEQSAAGTLAYFQGTAPGVFADRVVIPDAHDGDSLMLEGDRIEILPPMHGDTPLIAALHLPALNTLIAADFVYADTHAWMEENTKPEAIAAWRASLDLLEGLGATTVIPGHRQDVSPNDTSGFAQTRAYLDLWEKALATTKSADELRAALMAGNEALGFAFAVDRSVSAIYPG
jgi:glyoxylase-like metal-dependent hydrolase (beta-lactamase superfamily II)